jgi:AraC-like DNA-binding protein
MDDPACASDRATPLHVPITAKFLRDRVAEGRTLTAIAEEAGASRSRVYRLCKAHGIALPGRRGPARKVPAIADFVRRIEKGERPSDIARSAGAHPSAVHLALYRAGLQLQNGRISPKGN